MIKQISK